MSRKMMIAGNWKMNLNWKEAQKLTSELIKGLWSLELEDTEVVICPPYPYLNGLSQIIEDSGIENLYVGAQNCHQERQGAYTGEVSAQMLRFLDIPYVIIGHSERRAYQNESNELLKLKVEEAVFMNRKLIFCCGESLPDREAGKHFKVVETQLKSGLFHLDKQEMEQITIAYEPVWAIGTGQTASPEQAEEIHAHIRSLVGAKYGKRFAQGVSILYGGSCKPTNAKAIFSQANVDGGLIGGASLKAQDFIEIVKSTDF